MRCRDLTVTITLMVFFALNCCAFEDYNHPVSNSRVQADFADYMDNVRTKLQSNWTPPDFLENCHIRVTFKLDKDGNVLSGNIIESSGNDIYDSSAINAITKSEPFGRFPENSTRETITINYSFDTDLIRSDSVKYYYDLARRYTYSDRKEALKYIDLAIAAAGENENTYFLYNRRAKIKEGMGDHYGAKEDKDKFLAMKSKADLKRVHAIKHLAEIEDNAFSYYYLAYAYEQIGDYNNAIDAIDKAIERTDLNNQYKRYRAELATKTNN